MTAIIVNDRGEGFVGWRWSCSIAPSGVEDWFLVPAFAVPKTLTFGERGLIPWGKKPGDSMVLNQPYVFSSVRSAERAQKRLGRRTAVVS